MKTTTFVAILLTFLTLLLVLAAAVFFLWQGRQEASAEIGALREDRKALQATATIVRSYLAAREEGLATAQAGGTAEAQARAQAQATTVAVEETRSALADERAALATRSAEQETVLSRPPSIAIVYPRPGATLPAAVTGDEQQLLLVGSHPRGLSGVRIALAGNRVTLPGTGEPFAVFSYTLPVPLPAGYYTATATVTATNELTATTSVPFRVQGSAESGDEEGALRLPVAASRDRAFSAYPVFFKPAAIPLIVKKIALNNA